MDKLAAYEGLLSEHPLWKEGSAPAIAALTGGAVGAGAGAMMNDEDRLKGALIGGAIGAGSGGLLGASLKGLPVTRRQQRAAERKWARDLVNSYYFR